MSVERSSLEIHGRLFPETAIADGAPTRLAGSVTETRCDGSPRCAPFLRTTSSLPPESATGASAFIPIFVSVGSSARRAPRWTLNFSRFGCFGEPLRRFRSRSASTMKYAGIARPARGFAGARPRRRPRAGADCAPAANLASCTARKTCDSPRSPTCGTHGGLRRARASRAGSRGLRDRA